MVEISNLRRLIGKSVLGPGGERIGKVSAVYESTSGDATFATVSTGLFGTSSSFLPLASAELRGDDLHVPYSPKVVNDAPRVEADEDLTEAEEARLFDYYESVDGGSEHRTAAPVGPSPDGAMTRSEERVHVGTERVETGRARLRKYVVTETFTETVAVSHEELRVVREPILPGAPGIAAVTALSEEEHEIVLSAERPVVQKEIVPVERVRLATETITGEETVTEQVRKERVEVLSDGPVTEHEGITKTPAPTGDDETTTRTQLLVAPRRVTETGEDLPPDSTTEIVVEPRH